jgi:hypothetical protein
MGSVALAAWARGATEASMSKSIVATYATVRDANEAIEALHRAGFRNEEISLLITDVAKKKHFAIDQHSKAAEGAGIGSAIGGAVGALAAGLTVAAGLILPGLGALVAGPLIAALAGAGVGGAAGGLIGGLVGAGFSETEAKLIEDELKDGNIVIGVLHDDADRVRLARTVLEPTNKCKMS